jgi:hypothetical protein
MEPGFPVTLLGCSHPLVEEAELLGFAVGSADYLSPQTHSLCLWWLQKDCGVDSSCTRCHRRDGTPVSAAGHSPPSTAYSLHSASDSQFAGERPPCAASPGICQSQESTVQWQARRTPTKVNDYTNSGLHYTGFPPSY